MIESIDVGLKGEWGWGWGMNVERIWEKRGGGKKGDQENDKEKHQVDSVNSSTSTCIS